MIAESYVFLIFFFLMLIIIFLCGGGRDFGTVGCYTVMLAAETLQWEFHNNIKHINLKRHNMCTKKKKKIQYVRKGKSTREYFSMHTVK